MRLLRLVIACAILALAPLNLASAVEREYLVIGVDVSGSMRGDALKSTISAAEKIIRDLNSERVLELYVFTREPIKLDDVKYLETQTGGGYTALYDSIWTLTLRAAELSAPLIILTDGQDSRSSLSDRERLGGTETT
ncbi:MAG: VWA domain-containing protein, partial [Actinobacteria bacterium]|nr:VWA domain-containing protein [Actinomycetota bacterium]